MIDITFQEMSDALHISMGANFVFLPAALEWNHGALWGSLACVGGGLVKEFVFDLIWEDPQTSGGIPGGIRDFVGYLAGITLANLFLLGGLK